MPEVIKRIAIRVDLETWEQYDNKRHDQRVSFQQLGEALFRNWYQGEGASVSTKEPKAAGEIAIPAGRDDDFTDLAAILGSPPNEPIFKALDSILTEALNEYRKNWKRRQPTPKPKTTGKGDEHQRRSTGT